MIWVDTVCEVVHLGHIVAAPACPHERLQVQNVEEHGLALAHLAVFLVLSLLLRAFFFFVHLLGAIDVVDEQFVLVDEHAPMRDGPRDVATVVDVLPRRIVHMVAHRLQVYAPQGVVEAFVEVLAAQDVKPRAAGCVAHITSARR